ncbi:MAG: hypothetical protein KW802_00440 [Candidatus Doudnabacteria bacterium]|nr:hypothetical protein [Candidatus Doudnabacteria bacterium]
MSKLKLITSGIVFAIIIGFGIFGLARNRQVPLQQTSNVPVTAENLIKQSAKDMIDPKASPAATVNPSQIPEICTGETTFNCYEDFYNGLVKSKGVAAAFTDLKQRYDTNAYVKSQCHPITHVIGSAATQIYRDVGTAYTKGDSFCWSGYYHGVMEGVVGQITTADLPGKMNNICDKVPGKASYSFDYYNCVHGLGHGVMAITENELFDSLKLCDNLQGGWEQSSCHGGVFMENVIIDNKNHFTKFLKPSEPLYPCTAVDDKYKSTCYLMQTSYMLKVTNSDFAKVFDLCSTVGNFASICYQSLGRDASGRSISNVEATKATCYLGQGYDQRSNCIIGAVKDFISYYHSDVQGKQLCSALEEQLQQICFDTGEGYYRNFK